MVEKSFLNRSLFCLTLTKVQASAPQMHRFQLTLDLLGQFRISALNGGLSWEMSQCHTYLSYCE